MSNQTTENIYPRDELIDGAEMCRRFSIQPITLRRWRKKGLPFNRMSHNVIRFVWGEVMDWVDQRKEVQDEDKN